MIQTEIDLRVLASGCRDGVPIIKSRPAVRQYMRVLIRQMVAYRRTKMYKQSTTPKYWDCDCDDSYIHPKTEQVCKVCGADNSMADYPDSLIEEVIKFGLESPLEIKPGEYTELYVDPITHKNTRRKVRVVDTIRPDEDQNVAR